MLRRAILLGVLALVVVPVSLAANGEPQKRLTKADQARARAASLRLADLGRGWTAKPSGPDSGSNPRCSSYNPDQSDLIETGHYESPDFTRQDGSFVSLSTGVFKSIGMAKSAYSRVAKPTLPACFAEIFRKGTGNPKAVKIARVGALDFPKYGDRSNAYRLTGTIAVQTQTVRFAIDLVLFNRARIDAAMIFVGIGGALPASLEQALVGRVAKRAG